MQEGTSDLPSYKDFWNFSSKRFCHLAAAHVGNAVQGQTHEGGVAAGQIVLDRVVYEADQLTVGVHQDGDEEIALRSRKRIRRIYFSWHAMFSANATSNTSGHTASSISNVWAET